MDAHKIVDFISKILLFFIIAGFTLASCNYYKIQDLQDRVSQLEIQVKK